MKILIINGPNLNMLGIREPKIYGSGTYGELIRMIAENCREHGDGSDFFQSNHEGALVDRIQQAYFDGTEGIVINPGAYTHTSVAISDAVKAVGIPTVEVHISDVDSREDFRKINFIRAACVATVTGEGFGGYLHACDILREGRAPDESAEKGEL